MTRRTAGRPRLRRIRRLCRFRRWAAIRGNCPRSPAANRLQPVLPGCPAPWGHGLPARAAGKPPIIQSSKEPYLLLAGNCPAEHYGMWLRWGALWCRGLGGGSPQRQFVIRNSSFVIRGARLQRRRAPRYGIETLTRKNLLAALVAPHSSESSSLPSTV